MALTKRERILAAIAGGTVDHVPAVFSLHFPKEISAGDAAVTAHIDFYRRTDCDAVKIMNENPEPFIGRLQTPRDWEKVKAYRMNAEFATRQLDIVKRILDRVGPESYSLATIHGVCASSIHPIEAAYGYADARNVMCDTLRQNRRIMLDVHQKVADTMSELAAACIQAGADGIYYAALGAEKHFYTDEEFETYIKPYDLQIMKAARESGGHVFLHICKENLNMDRYRGYAPYADVVNWGVYETNFSLEQGRALFPTSTIMGGLANRSGVLVSGTYEELAEAVRSIIHMFGERKFILGADCTLPTEIPYKRIMAAVHAAII